MNHCIDFSWISYRNKVGRIRPLTCKRNVLPVSIMLWIYPYSLPTIKTCQGVFCGIRHHFPLIIIYNKTLYNYITEMCFLTKVPTAPFCGKKTQGMKISGSLQSSCFEYSIRGGWWHHSLHHPNQLLASPSKSSEINKKPEPSPHSPSTLVAPVVLLNQNKPCLWEETKLGLYFLSKRIFVGTVQGWHPPSSSWAPYLAFFFQVPSLSTPSPLIPAGSEFLLQSGKP